MRVSTIPCMHIQYENNLESVDTGSFCYATVISMKYYMATLKGNVDELNFKVIMCCIYVS